MNIKVYFSNRTIIVTVQKRFFFIVRFIFAVMARVVIILAQLIGIKYKKTLFMKGMSGWSIGMCIGTSPLDLRSFGDVHNPVFAALNVTDVPAAFVADPFMIKSNSSWHLFFEVFNIRSRKGEIGLAVSDDGLQWAYKQIVLAEPFHLSYPYVFEWDGIYYMIPESAQDESVRLYKAVQFPTRWSLVATLLRGMYVDTSVLNHEGKWWMFTAESRYNNILHLYYADAILGPWVKHPLSPIIKGDNRIARPAGRVLLYNGRIIRYAQDCGLNYGNGVRAFEITKLTATDYAEYEASENPILKVSCRGWNKKGMHTIDAHQIGKNKWIAAIDGYGKDLFFVGY